jgi:flagellar capping protein FliD
LADLAGGGALATAGDLTINGVLVGSFGPSSTFGSVISAINSTSATGVTASVDAVNGKLVLTANGIGSTGITVNNDNGLGTLLGLSSSNVSRGKGVTYNLSVNGNVVGTDLTSDSSTIDISKYGYGSTQLTVANSGKFNVQVTGSGASFKSKISTFISAYNTLKQMLDDSTKITVGSDGKVQASVFSNRSDINNLLSSIRSKIYTSVSGTSINSSYDNASKIGLGFDSSGLLSITDSTKLDAALANSPSSVDALLNLNKTAAISTASSQLGIATRINNLITVMVGVLQIPKTRSLLYIKSHLLLIRALI